MSQEIIVYGKKLGCPNCFQMKYMLEVRDLKEGKDYTFIDVTEDHETLQMLKSKGISEVPQIEWKGEWIGGLTNFRQRVNELCSGKN